MNKTPNVPPTSAIKKISKSPGASIPSTPSAAHKNNAGNVKIAPAATDSPAEPIVCTMLFSKIESLLRITRIIPMERTAAGIDADTVIPTLNPRYAFAAPKTTAKRIPMNSDVNVNSGTILSAEINGLKSFLLSILFSPILYYFNALSPQSIIAPFCPQVTYFCFYFIFFRNFCILFSFKSATFNKIVYTSHDDKSNHKQKNQC